MADARSCRRWRSPQALASEVTSTFSKRLAPLGLIVKELTGDMQLTKKELQETQMIVTTPEKWDVITRKVRRFTPCLQGLPCCLTQLAMYVSASWIVGPSPWSDIHARAVRDCLRYRVCVAYERV